MKPYNRHTNANITFTQRKKNQKGRNVSLSLSIALCRVWCYHMNNDHTQKECKKDENKEWNRYYHRKKVWMKMDANSAVRLLTFIVCLSMLRSQKYRIRVLFFIRSLFVVQSLLNGLHVGIFGNNEKIYAAPVQTKFKLNVGK